MRKATYTLLLAATTVLGCNKDEENRCQNGGYEVVGTCICPDGYSGQDCELRINQKFTGTYIGNTYENGNYVTITIQVDQHPNNDPRSLQVFKIDGSQKIYITDVYVTDPTRASFTDIGIDGVTLTATMTMSISNTNYLYFNLQKRQPSGSTTYIYNFNGDRVN